jgi:hypothetical protein
VQRLDIVHTGRAPLPEPEPEPDVSKSPTGPSGTSEQASSLNYGNSFTQNDLINTIPLHDLGYNGNGVLICMLDAGFNNLGHDAFNVMDILITRDFVNGDSVVSDELGQMGSGNHGTNTLSVIGGYAPGELTRWPRPRTPRGNATSRKTHGWRARSGRTASAPTSSRVRSATAADSLTARPATRGPIWTATPPS